MQISEERITEFKEIFKKEYGKELSNEEAHESAYNLVGLFKALYDSAMKDAKRKRRLKKEPDGFPVDGQYSCLVCGKSINASNGWYHHGGQRCLMCHKAVKDGIIPQFVFEGRDSYYSMWHLKDRFGIKSPTARKMVREGKLKARMIINENGTVHEYIFLKKENPEYVDPKRHNPLRKSHDRNQDKIHKKWAREEAKKMKAERKKKLQIHTRSY